MKDIPNEYILIFFWILYFIFVIWGLKKVMSGIAIILNTRTFKINLNRAIQDSTPTWEDIKHLQDDSGISSRDCLWVFNKIKTSLIVSGNKEKNKRALIDNYITMISKEDPYEGIPDKIKMHLMTIQEQLNGVTALTLLAKEIRTLIVSNKKEYNLLKFCTVGGFFIGSIGFIIMIYQMIGTAQN